MNQLRRDPDWTGIVTRDIPHATRGLFYRPLDNVIARDRDARILQLTYAALAEEIPCSCMKEIEMVKFRSRVPLVARVRPATAISLDRSLDRSLTLMEVLTSIALHAG